MVAILLSLLAASWSSVSQGVGLTLIKNAFARASNEYISIYAFPSGLYNNIIILKYIRHQYIPYTPTRFTKMLCRVKKGMIST